MATLLLSAAGAAIGSGFGGAVLGLSGAVIGRAVGATIGRSIDQRLLGLGADPVEVGRLDRLRLTGTSEGASIQTVWGRMRIAGQVIWASQFVETATRRRAGKATGPRTTEYSYSISLAIGLCKGEILRIGRIWADGMEISKRSLSYRIYTGTEDQLPDAKIEAVEGSGRVPAFRGLAYIVIEDLDLAPYGNRVPQFTFEVVRPAQAAGLSPTSRYDQIIRSVALIPGTGEYALATTPVSQSLGPGQSRSLNVNTPSELTDFETSLEQLVEELPNCQSVGLVVSWFGNDLRCNLCEVKPKVEQTGLDPAGMPWRSGGIGRSEADVVPQIEGRSIYGGTPADASVVEGIRAMRDAGLEVMFYPFILMDQVDGNTLPDPWSGDTGQPALPWRGRITTSIAAGRNGTPDRTPAAAAEVQAFFGTAQPQDFALSGGQVVYSGPQDWGFRRFILHYAWLCQLAGGVDAFCIGSELRGLTRIRGGSDSFPAVQALKSLAAEVKAILGPGCKVSYAADWTEYGAYVADGNVYFPLDDLWADPSVDFIGIDNYMPLSDWRDFDGNADASWGSVHNLEYLKANVAGGEYFDWYFDSPEGEAAQVRLPIEDPVHQEPWVFRLKDLRGWWSNAHHPRIADERLGVATAWVPQSKPIRFTEYGCAAIDKGTNQPNRFLDRYSSESGLPRASKGCRDDLVQFQYYRAINEVWSDPAANPVSPIYGQAMLDLARSHAWAWDARPYPAFPGRSDIWADSVNYGPGHWLNGRATNQPLSNILAEVAESAGVAEIDADQAYALVAGYQAESPQTARAIMQPLLLAYAVDPSENGGVIGFASRGVGAIHDVDLQMAAVAEDGSGHPEWTRSSPVEVPSQVRLAYVAADGTYDTRVADLNQATTATPGVSGAEFPLVLTSAEASATVARWMAETRVSRDTVRLSLPPSFAYVRSGDSLRWSDGSSFRVEAIEVAETRVLEASRVEPEIYKQCLAADDVLPSIPFIPAAPVFPLYLDLPLLTGLEQPHQPHVAVAARPWPGPVAFWSSADGDSFDLTTLVSAPSAVAVTETPLAYARSGLWDEGEPLRIRLVSGEISSATFLSVLNGANVIAIGDGTPSNWEVLQFRNASLVTEDVYELSGRLRGQAGTDVTAPAEWPIGSYVVVIDRAVPQLDVPLAARNLSRTYRVGAAGRGYDDPNVVSANLAFTGIGFRPLSVAHLQVQGHSGSDVQVTWIRRTRIEGDSWDLPDVPLGEDEELYTIRIVDGLSVLATYSTVAPAFQYTASMQAADAVPASFRIEVAMVSSRFGAGPFRSVDVLP